ncbi:hypothetical protein [Capnocytophaga granulosa]|uniref:hypothetical protein n=1 Tax=Capnocytophaga granulosa TaxID=45242 RepID=UPI0038574AB3
MKELNIYKRIWLILMILSPFFSLVKAQTCDPNILKALEQTRVSVFDKVTKGEKVTVTIKYPLKGTTYVVSDNDGNSKSVTYTGTDEFLNIEMDEPVNVTRRYSLKMTNGHCTYQTGFNYTVTPETDINLAYRVEHEWCGNSGAIRFNIVGTGVIVTIIASILRIALMLLMILLLHYLLQGRFPGLRAATILWPNL